MQTDGNLGREPQLRPVENLAVIPIDVSRGAGVKLNIRGGAWQAPQMPICGGTPKFAPKAQSKPGCTYAGMGRIGVFATSNLNLDQCNRHINRDVMFLT
jgi:hypothetical protein